MAVVVLALITPMIAAFVPFVVFLCVRRAANKKQEPPRPTIEMKAYVNRSELHSPTSLDAASYVAPSFMDENGDTSGAGDDDQKETIRISIAEADEGEDRTHVNTTYDTSYTVTATTRTTKAAAATTGAGAAASAPNGRDHAEMDVDEEDVLSSFYDLAEEAASSSSAAAAAVTPSSSSQIPDYENIGMDEVAVPARMPGDDEKKTPSVFSLRSGTRTAFGSTSGGDNDNDSNSNSNSNSNEDGNSARGTGSTDAHLRGTAAAGGGRGGGGDFDRRRHGRVRVESEMSDGSDIAGAGIRRSSAQEEDAAMMGKPLRPGGVDEDGFTVRATPSPPQQHERRRRQDSFYSDSDSEDFDDEEERTRKLRSISIREASTSTTASMADVHVGIQNLSQTLGPAPSTRSVRAKSTPSNAPDPFGDISIVTGAPTSGAPSDPFAASTPLATPAQGRASRRVAKPSALANMHTSTPQAPASTSTPSPLSPTTPGDTGTVFDDDPKRTAGGGSDDNASSLQQQHHQKRKQTQSGTTDPFAVEGSSARDPFSVGSEADDNDPVVLGFGDDDDDGDGIVVYHNGADRRERGLQQRLEAEGTETGNEEGAGSRKQEEEEGAARDDGEKGSPRHVDFVDVRTLKFLPTPLEEVPRDVLSAVKTRLRTLGLKLWLLPYTDEKGAAHIPASLVDDFSSAVDADRRTVAAALERLRVTAYNKKVLSLQRKATTMDPDTNTQA